MDTSDIFELLKYIIPSVVIFIGTYFIMQNFFENQWKERGYEVKAKELELKNKEITERNRIVLPIKLQAYERLIIFLERISPNSSLQRVRLPGMSASDLQLALITNIRAEFEHNTAQQLYISKDAWQLVKTVKEEMIKLYNLIGANIAKEASGLDYSKAILEYLLNSEKDLPTDTAIKFLKQDAAKYLD
ncbi:MAG: hypothetical protein KDD32_00345 [Bacteroidetes bacterium]|nr:hypothetical protein [Bacteroidota bacterium]